jgi:hypothetical protein
LFRGFVFGVLATIVVGLACAYVVLRLGIIPANADATPGALETWVASTSLRATLDRESPKGPNPVALTDANLIAGIDLYGQHCAICHGTAKGDASASPVAKGEYPGPRSVPETYGQAPAGGRRGLAERQELRPGFSLMRPDCCASRPRAGPRRRNVRCVRWLDPRQYRRPDPVLYPRHHGAGFGGHSAVT